MGWGAGRGTLSTRYLCAVSCDAVAASWQGRVRVTFVDAFGTEEMGIDQGGLFKEFLTDLAKAAFNPKCVSPRPAPATPSTARMPAPAACCFFSAPGPVGKSPPGTLSSGS